MERVEGYVPQQYLYMLGRDGKVTDKKQLSSKAADTDMPCFRIIPDEDEKIVGDVSERSADADNSLFSRKDIADFSELYTFYSTGDPEQDRLIEMGMEYKKSCFDFTNAKDFERLTEEQKQNGFENMSRAEKYKAIYEKYQHCYGNNFLDALAIDYVNPPTSEDRCMSVLIQFRKEVNEACGGYANVPKARRAALYGEMSDEEIRQSIMDKYSQDGGMTQRDLFKAANEMDLCGVGGGISNMLNPIGNPSTYKSGENPMITRENQLDAPVMVQYLNNVQNVCKNRLLSGGSINMEIFAVIEQIMKEIE
ncbi:MAG: hypothetical protein ACI4XF_09310 [Oscillospiraceae bacterium]